MAAARTLTQRLVERCAHRLPDASCAPRLLFPDAASILATPLDQLGLTGQRITTLKALAQAVSSGQLDLDNGHADEIDSQLDSLPGIGPWTRAYIRLRAFKHPDAFPAGDIVLRKALGDGAPLSAHEAEVRSQRWQPWRAYAVMTLWQHASDQQARTNA